ncbi:MAG: FkbM family methyltransferase [Nitrososphaerota archaeon]
MKGIKRLKKGDIVIDCGAHVGIFTLKAAKVGAKVLAIEPDPLNYVLLKMNIALNGFNNIHVIKVAVGKEDKGVEEIIPWGRKTRVPIRSIKSIASEFNLEHVDFLKMDIEGAEVDAIDGIGELHVRNIAMEYHSYCGKDKVIACLRKMGFKIAILERGRTGYIFAHKMELS